MGCINKADLAPVAGHFILLASGIHFGFCFYFLYDIPQDPIYTQGQVNFYQLCTYVGPIVGAAISGVLVTLYGNKRAIGVSIVMLFVSGVFYIVNINKIETMICGRLLAGGAGGVAAVAQIIYISETSPVRCRGRRLVAISYVTSLGALVQYILNEFVEGGDVNMTVGVMSVVIAGLATIFFFLMRESPCYLIYKHFDLKAKENISYFKNDIIEINDEFNEIKTCITEECASRISVHGELWRRNRNGFLMASLLKLAYVGTFNIPLIDYNAMFLAKTQLLIINSQVQLSMVLIGAARVLGIFISAILIDNFGRRRLITISGSVGAVCLIAIPAMTTANELYNITSWPVDSVKPNLYATAIVVLIFELFIGLGFGSISNVVLGECLTTPAKAFGVSVDIIIQGAVGLLYYMVLLIDGVRSFDCFLGIYITSTIVLLIATIISYKYLPETKNKAHRDVIRLYKRY